MISRETCILQLLIVLKLELTTELYEEYESAKEFYLKTIKGFLWKGSYGFVLCVMVVLLISDGF